MTYLSRLKPAPLPVLASACSPLHLVRQLLHLLTSFSCSPAPPHLPGCQIQCLFQLPQQLRTLPNAEDNKYPTDVIPSLEFVITSTDITATGANSTLLVFNNEIGFSPANIESICRIGKSTKKRSRHLGYIGEKGNKGEKRKKRDLPQKFISTLGKDWLRTTMGYQSPSASFLFDSKWAHFLQIEDCPFLDEAFYVSDLTLYRNELKSIGVIVDVGDGCQLLARNMKFHSDISAISRIYKYLIAKSLKVEFQGSNCIWIPNESSGGQWVSSESCIIQDENNFFHSRFYVLDRYYEKSLLWFFSSVLGVRHGPGVEDYCKLWVTWEATSSDLTNSQCTAFWQFISKKWNNQTEKLLSGYISKVPVCKGNQILLSNKVDVFIPDDLLIKDLLDTASEETIFVWYPRTFLPLLPMKKLNDIYRSIGIRTISEAVEMDELLFPPGNHVHPADPSHDLLKKCLLRIVLAFLADPLLSIHPEERHQIVKILCGLTILETDKPITVSFKVALSSGTLLVAEAEKMFRLEKETSKLFIQKKKKKKGAEGSKQRLECATDLADVISKTILFERTEMIPALSELLKLSCLLDFEEDAVEYMLKTKNLQLFADDEAFLSSGCLSYGIVALN